MILRLASLLCTLLMAVPCSRAEGPLIAPGAQVKKLVGDLKFGEGAACDPHGNVFFTDKPNDRILTWTLSGKLIPFLQPSSQANGLCFDGQGRLWACAEEAKELRCLDANGKTLESIKDYAGKRLNGPNDLWVRPDGGIYVTDPSYNHSTPPPQDAEAVYFVANGGHEFKRVISDLRRPNGIIGTQDGKLLYVADLLAQQTFRYTVAADGSVRDKHPFCAMGSDGMTMDERGNLYLTGQDAVFVFNPAGEKIEQIAMPEPGWVGNVCFGGKARKTLFITAMKNLFSLEMQVKGVGSQ